METQRITQSFDSDKSGEPRRQLSAGTTLTDRYLIQEVIGVGGMGSVYRARDLHFPSVVKLVAVKEMINMAPDPAVRQVIVQNFEREANLLATLNHSAIPRIYDYFTQNDLSYLVLEFIHGKDLEAIPKTQVFDGLKAATKECGRDKTYHKGRHSFEILGRINPALVEKESPHAKRFLDHLKQLTDSGSRG